MKSSSPTIPVQVRWSPSMTRLKDCGYQPPRKGAKAVPVLDLSDEPSL